jgi:thiamine-phosphate pyrophosphorylase
VPNCQLYLLSPEKLPSDFIAQLREALRAGNVAALRMRMAGAAPDVVANTIAQVRPLAVTFGTALILDWHVALAVSTRCDGLHLADVASVAPARQVIGDLQLGVFCAGSRDLALQAGEAGADYVSFGPYFERHNAPDIDLITWWSQLMELPVVAEGFITAANAATLVRAGADFLAVDAAVWNHPQGPAAGVAAMNAAIAAA